MKQGKARAIEKGTRARAGHDPRIAALRVLDRVLHGMESSQAALDEALRESSLTPSDAGLCTELVYGCLRHKLLLDWWQARLMKNPGKLPEEMRLILILAFYELAFLDKVPAYATVHGAVSRVRNRFGAALSSVANGTLRSFQRGLGDVRSPAFYEKFCSGAAEALALRHSLPAWIPALWTAAYGEDEARALCEASAARPPAGVRINARAPGAKEFRETLLRDLNGTAVGEWGIAFPEGAPPWLRREEAKGRLSYQSPAVQEALEGIPRELLTAPLWDACAGRGGKSLALLERDIPVSAATDSSLPRINGLTRELARLGLDRTPDFDGAHPGAHLGPPAVFCADARHAALGDTFATIIADVPCSGLGTLCRRPEIRLRRSEEDIAAFCAVQRDILDAAAPLTKAGGRVIYLTCTVTPEENEGQVADFLARHPDFRLHSMWRTPVDSPWKEVMFRAIVEKTGN